MAKNTKCSADFTVLLIIYIAIHQNKRHQWPRAAHDLVTDAVQKPLATISVEIVD